MSRVAIQDFLRKLVAPVSWIPGLAAFNNKPIAVASLRIFQENICLGLVPGQSSTIVLLKNARAS